MSAGAVVFERLASQTSAEDRIYPLVLPGKPMSEAAQYPAISYQQISAVRLHAMGSDAGLVRVRMQVNVWGQTYAQARTLANEVTARLSRFRGVSAGVTVQDILLDNEMEGFETSALTRRFIQEYTVLLADS